MWDLAVREEDYQAVDDMLARYGSLPPLSMRLLPAAARSDTAAIQEHLAEGRALESRQLQIAARYAASYLEEFELADSLARLDLAWRQRPAIRATAQVLMGHLAAGAGRWSAAQAAFEAAETMEGAGAVVVHRAMAATLPLQPVPTADLRAIREEVERWDASPTAADVGLTRELLPHLRLYLLGLLSSRLSDDVAAERAATAIERLPTPPVGQALARSMAATVRADMAWMEGSPQDVLRALGEDPQIPLELIASSRGDHLREFGLEHARYLRASSLAVLGEDTEALRWLRFGLRGSPQEHLYHAPVHFQLGGLFERMGQRDSADVHYGRFIELWSRADSGAISLLDQARGRLRPDGE